MSKHTPGPWRIDGSEVSCEGMGALAVVSSDDLRPEGYFIVAAVVDISTEVWPKAGSCEANARLIAAAPDLLNTCKFALDSLERSGLGDSWTATILRETIAKAEGEG